MPNGTRRGPCDGGQPREGGADSRRYARRVPVTLGKPERDQCLAAILLQLLTRQKPRLRRATGVSGVGGDGGYLNLSVSTREELWGTEMGAGLGSDRLSQDRGAHDHRASYSWPASPY